MHLGQLGWGTNTENLGVEHDPQESVTVCTTSTFMPKGA